MSQPRDGAPAPLDDAEYPAYTMGSAATMLGVQPDFLRGLEEAGLLRPARSGGGHRRYSRVDLRLAARARELVDGGLTLAAACRIVALENQLAGARAELADARDELAGTQERLAGTRAELKKARDSLSDLQDRPDRS